MAVLSDDMGGITAYAAAVNRGYTGTKEEFEQLMYSYTEVAERAEAAAGNAHESEENSIEAKDIAVNAKNEAVSARDAAISARDASISAKNNSESARDVAISAKDDTLAAKDAVMSAKNSIDETSANFSDEVTAAISDVNAAGRNQKELAKTHAIDSEAWAVGQREGADVGVSDTTYHNNSKYYAEQSELAKSETETARDTAITAKNNAVSAKNEAETAKGEAQDIVDGINAKSEQIDQNAEDITALQTAIVTKAEVDGNYEDMTVGTAEQLIGEVVSEDSVPYIIRKSLADGSDRLYNQIVGGTVNWNQLIQNGNFSNGNNRWTVYMATATYGNNIATIVTADSVDINSGGSLYQNEISMLANHKYIVSATIKGDGEHRVALRADGGLIFDTITNISSDFKTFVGVAAGASGYSSGRVVITAYGPSVTVYLKNVVLFDLTAMFGSTIADYIYQLEQAHAGDGVAFFKSLFPNDYYEYNSGELVSVSGLSEHKMVGFNQWDEEWEVGGLSTANGNIISSDTAIRSKNYISCLPSTNYYLKSNNAASYVWFYDGNKNFIGFSTSTLNMAFTTPSNCRFMKLRIGDSNNIAQTYNHDICINISDPTKNGTYEPYKAHSYPLDSTLTLRGVFKLDANNNFYADGDTYDADGTVTRRYGVVDLGTLIWTKSTDYANPIFYASISDIISGVQDKKLVCSKYDYVVGLSAGTVADYTTPVIGTPTANTQVIVRDPNYDNSDGATFKAAMSGVYLVYRLATPITEQAQSFTNPQIVDDFGTEEYVTDSIVPVGHVTKYANNLRAKLEMAPNSPDGDGDYIVRQTSGLNEYVSLSSSEVIQNINEAISDNASDISELKEDTTQLKSELTDSDILTDSPTATAFANCSIYSNGAIIGSSGFNVYVFNIAGINRIKINGGSIYAFYESMPSVNVTPSIDSMRHIRTLNNTELRVPSGANYVAVRHTVEPTVTDIDTLKRTVDDLEYIKAFNTKSILFNVTGKYINTSGTETANAEYACTDYIDAVGGAEFTVHAFYSSYASFASYDADKNVVEVWRNTGALGDLVTYTLQSNVRYVRWSVNANYIDDINAVTAYITNNIDDLIKPKERCGYDGYEINVFKHGICIGDSLTAGTFNYDDNGVNKSDYADVNYSFPKMLSKLTGIEIYTSAVGGNTSYEWYQDHISATIAGFDFAIIQFGVNDALEYNGWTENSVNGFTGIINILKRDSNGIKIFVATTIPALAYGGQAFNDVNNGIRELVASMNDENVILLDMAKYGSTKLKQYNAGHLTAIGYSRLANDYKNYISWYISEHPDEFMAVQFIGTNKVIPSEYNWYD